MMHTAVPFGFRYATAPCDEEGEGCDFQDEEEMAAAVATRGPVSVCVNAADWQFYQGGILNGYRRVR